MAGTIIFDAEGVVVDTEAIWDAGQEEFLRRRGLVYDRERIKPLLTGTSIREGVVALQRAYGFGGDVASLAHERVEIVRRRFEHDVEFVEGFLPFFEAVRSEFKTCVATSMDEELLAAVDRRLHLSSLFGGDHIFTLASTGSRPKPEPDLFVAAAARLGSPPADCVVLEDSPYGLEAARRAGMVAVGLATTYDPAQLAAAVLVVRSFEELGTSRLRSLEPDRGATTRA